VVVVYPRRKAFLLVVVLVYASKIHNYLYLYFVLVMVLVFLVGNDYL